MRKLDFNTTLVKVHLCLSSGSTLSSINFNTTLVKVHLSQFKAGDIKYIISIQPLLRFITVSYAKIGAIILFQYNPC